jgi:hypothetical protein
MASSAVAGPKPKTVESALRAMVWLAAPSGADGKQTFVTCAGVVVDARQRTVATPLQCAPADVVHCASAASVPTDQVVGFKALQAWPDRCHVIRRLPKAGLALLRYAGAHSLEAARVETRPTHPGQAVFTVGFPMQIPGFLSPGTISKPALRGLPLDGLPATFSTPLMLVVGANAKGSAGAGVFNESGSLVGLVLADLYALDGAAAVPGKVLHEAGVPSK